MQELEVDREALSEFAPTPPPESQFSLNWQMIDGYGGNVQVTMRGSYVGEWPEIMQERAKFVDLAQKKGWTFPGSVKPAAGLTPPPAAPAAPVAAPSNGTATSTVKVVQVLSATELRVMPRADGKVDLEFWNTGRQYAEIKATKAPAEAVAMLAATGAWALDNFSKAGAFTLPVTIEYRLSDKLNSKGNPYKDVLAVKPA